MSLFWDNVKEKVKTGFAFSSEKIEEYSYIGKLKLDIIGAKRSIDSSYRELGKRVFQMLEEEKTDEISGDEKVNSASAKIKEGKKTLSGLEEKYADASRKNKQEEKAESEEKIESEDKAEPEE